MNNELTSTITIPCKQSEKAAWVRSADGKLAEWVREKLNAETREPDAWGVVFDDGSCFGFPSRGEAESVCREEAYRSPVLRPIYYGENV